MALEFDFIGPGDKPAIVLLSTSEWQETAKGVLFELGYKVHAPHTHEEFTSRFGQLHYHVVIAELLFAASSPAENLSFLALQRMPMNQRRRATIFLIGHQFETMNAMQAFQQSVHAVINPHELHSLGQIVKQVVGDNDLLLGLFRDTQVRIAQGKL